MKIQDTVILLILAICVIAAAVSIRKGGTCSCGSCSDAKPIRVRDRNPHHYSHEAMIRIEGMTCSGCAVKVDNALNQMDGVWSRTDRNQNQADVLMKEPLDEKLLRQKVREAGYSISSIVWKS